MSYKRLSICKRIGASLAISALAASVGMSLLACGKLRTANVPTFLQEYHRGLVALCDPQLEVVTCALTNESSTRYLCTINCRDRVTAAASTLRFTIFCNELGLIESISADHPLALGEDQPLTPGTAVPIETVMYAVAGTSMAPSESVDLKVKQFKIRLSYGNPDYYKAASLAQMQATCPTEISSFDDVTKFTFGLSQDTDGFSYVVQRAAGVISGKKHNKFKWQSTSMYGTNDSPAVGLFLATLNRDTLSMHYRHKQGNQDGLLMPSNIFISVHESTRTNKPVRGVGFGAVALNIDSDRHVVTNMPVLFKMTHSALSISKCKPPKPKKPKPTL